MQKPNLILLHFAVEKMEKNNTRKGVGKRAEARTKNKFPQMRTIKKKTFTGTLEFTSKSIFVKKTQLLCDI